MPEWLFAAACGLVVAFVLFKAFAKPPGRDPMKSNDPPDVPPGVGSY